MTKSLTVGSAPRALIASIESRKEPIPFDALDADILIIGQKGGGKSFTGRGLVERLLAIGERVVIIDPLGGWHGLKSAYDGNAPGFNVAVFGGKNGDMPLTVEMAEPLGQLIGENNLPAIMDTSLMGKSPERQFVAAFSRSLSEHNPKIPINVVLEEAHLFAPQNPQGGSAAMCLAAVEDMAKLGRVAGIRLILITQRPARLHKDVMSQAATMISMVLRLEHDQKAAIAWFKGNAGTAIAKEVSEGIGDLATGEGFFYAAKEGSFGRVKFPMIATYDSTRTPARGEVIEPPTSFATVDLSAVKAALLSNTEEDEKKPKSKLKKPDIAPGMVLIPEVELDRIKSDRYDLGVSVAHQLFAEQIGDWFANAAIHVQDELQSYIQREMEKHLNREGDGNLKVSLKNDDAPKSVSRETSSKPKSKTKPKKTTPQKASKSDIPHPNDLKKEPLFKIVERVYPVALSWPALCSLIGRKPRGGHFNTVKRKLLDAGLLFEEHGKVVTKMTPDPVNRGAEKTAMEILINVTNSAQSNLIRAIHDDPGKEWEEYADDLGVMPTGGHWNTIKAFLRTNDLITDDDGIRIHPSLLENLS